MDGIAGSENHLASAACAAALADTDAGCQCYPTLSGVAMRRKMRIT